MAEIQPARQSLVALNSTNVAGKAELVDSPRPAACDVVDHARLTAVLSQDDHCQVAVTLACVARRGGILAETGHHKREGVTVAHRRFSEDLSCSS